MRGRSKLHYNHRGSSGGQVELAEDSGAGDGGRRTTRWHAVRVANPTKRMASMPTTRNSDVAASVSRQAEARQPCGSHLHSYCIGQGMCVSIQLRVVDERLGCAYSAQEVVGPAHRVLAIVFRV